MIFPPQTPPALVYGLSPKASSAVITTEDEVCRLAGLTVQTAMRRSYDTKNLGACKHIDLKIRMEVVLYEDHSYIAH